MLPGADGSPTNKVEENLCCIINPWRSDACMYCHKHWCLDHLECDKAPRGLLRWHVSLLDKLRGQGLEPDRE